MKQENTGNAVRMIHMIHTRYLVADVISFYNMIPGIIQQSSCTVVDPFYT